MPIIKSSRKALRQSRRRAAVNSAKRSGLEIAYKKATAANISQVISKIDKAVKTKILSPQRANRLKSRLYKKLKVSNPIPRTKPLATKTGKIKKTKPKTKPKKVKP